MRRPTKDKFFLILILIIVSASILLIVIIFLFAPRCFPEHLRDLGIRVSLATLFIETVNVAALAIAAWQLYQSQRSPELQVWIEPRMGGTSTGNPANVSNQWSLIQHLSGTEIQTYNFQFGLLLENRGTAVARWVKISITIPETPEWVKERKLIRLVGEEPGVGKWVPAATYSDQFTFYGGDDFVAFSRPSTVKDLRPWLTKVGAFILELRVSVPDIDDIEAAKVQLLCSVQADGFVDHEQALSFSLGRKARGP
jgi:hypothetical protein